MTNTNVQDIKCIWDAAAIVGEGPIFDPRTSALLWVDIKGEKLFSYDTKTGAKKMFSVPGNLSALGLRRSGGYIGTNRNGFHYVTLSPDPVLTPLSDPERSLPGNRFNDGKTDPFGGFWAGTMDDSEVDRTAGSWWRYVSDGTVQKMDGGLHVTNGPAFDPHKSRVYVNDSARQTIFKANYSAGKAMKNKTVFMTFGDGDGYPDGMTVDRFGNLWVAFWDGWCLRQMSPTGKIIRQIDLPIPRPTSIAIVDKYLYITSASIGLEPDDLKKAPLSGGLFQVDLKTNTEPEAFYFQDARI